VKYLEDIGHVLIGFIPGYGVFREIRQLPPENNSNPVVMIGNTPYWSSVRVSDMLRDMVGYAIGDIFRTAILVWMVLH
jgi:hypothetical protein